MHVAQRLYSLLTSLSLLVLVPACATDDGVVMPEADSGEFVDSDGSEPNPRGGLDCSCPTCWRGCWVITGHRVGVAIDADFVPQLIDSPTEFRIDVDEFGVVTLPADFDRASCQSGQCGIEVVLDPDRMSFETSPPPDTTEFLERVQQCGQLTLGSTDSDEVALGRAAQLGPIDADACSAS